jgi:hypothetical protein
MNYWRAPRDICITPAVNHARIAPRSVADTETGAIKERHRSARDAIRDSRIAPVVTNGRYPELKPRGRNHPKVVRSRRHA